ncbi:MAG TPA: hypothetical protein VEU76_02055 [Candidatus Udaeobacter sp.]|nr:hypothetical protein [Candidatus Udaeobacter sp.]
MKALLDRTYWSGPLGIARIVLILSAVWLLIVSAASLLDLMSVSKAVLPAGIMMVALGFVAGYQMGQTHRP